MDTQDTTSPQWWWASVIVPLGLAVRWLVLFGREGQAELLQTQSQLVAQLLETNSSLRRRTLELEQEVETLKHYTGRLSDYRAAENAARDLRENPFRPYA